ncbi:hypothetical protein [Cuniculiplasma divulgatum]|uniref:hypothetical protein n=1 Tax=Cuniculiplasma divulgatum TaxID=1673428 RepID=UPI00097DAB94|nr:hypothetical protein [Cuniculiplasma divulgatum]
MMILKNLKDLQGSTVSVNYIGPKNAPYKLTGEFQRILGLKTDRPRITRTRKGNDGNDQDYTKRYTVVKIPDEKKISELRSRYDTEFVLAKLSSIEQAQQSILDDEDDEKGSPHTQSNSKNDIKANKSKPQQSKKENDQLPPFQNDSPLRPLSPDLQGDPLKPDVQNENSNNDERNLNQEPLHGLPLTKEQGEESVNLLLEHGVHLNASDTGVSIYGDKFNIAIPRAYYRQNSETVDRLMKDLGFTRGNKGSEANVFFSRPLKGGDQQ